MIKHLYFIIFFLGLILLPASDLKAGNPDRQGEAGAYELLMNPWARSAGLHTMNTSFISGVEAMRLNIAGLVRLDNQLEVYGSHAIYLDGTDISMNALGFGSKIGKNGALGVSIMALDFGDIRVTTTDQPGGTGATFSPSFFNIGLGYSHQFENKVSVGILVRGISESISDLNAFGFCIDAGIQYVTGAQDNFKFGIALRNVGGRMKFNGEGLAVQRPTEQGYELTFDQRSNDFELPSMLNIGASYDFLLGEKNRITALANFTSNSFSEDQVGGGLEYAFNEMFMVRAAYKYDFGLGDEIREPIYTGLSAGATIDVPISRRNPDLRFGIDYAYRTTKIWNGTHNIGVRLNF